MATRKQQKKDEPQPGVIAGPITVTDPHSYIRLTINPTTKPGAKRKRT